MRNYQLKTMELQLKRIALKPGYTIGRLYLKDTAPLGGGTEGAPQYLCDTLEPTMAQPRTRRLQDSGQDGNTRRQIPDSRNMVAKVWPLAAAAGGSAAVRWHTHPQRQHTARHPGLHPRGRKQGEGQGVKLAHRYVQTDETARREKTRRTGMDYHLLKLPMPVNKIYVKAACSYIRIGGFILLT